MNIRRTAAFTALTLMASAAVVGCSAAPTESEASTSASCSPAADLTTITPGTLTVGVTDVPPFASNVTGGGAEGIDIDILNHIADALCLKISYVAATYANSIPLISEQGAIDLTSGDWYPTTARAEVVDFTSPTYYDAMGIVSASGASTVEALTTIGTVGTVAGYLWEEDLKNLLGDNLQTYQSSYELAQDLENGRLQAAIDSYGVSANVYADTDFKVVMSEADDRVEATIEKAQSAFPITKGNTSLQEALNEQIELMREDGTMVSIVEAAGLSGDVVVPAGVELKLIG